MAPYSETRDDRIREYHVVNANPVVGLEEGSWLVIEDGVVTAPGTARVRLPGARVVRGAGPRAPLKSPSSTHDESNP